MPGREHALCRDHSSLGADPELLPACAWNGRGVSSGTLFLQNATRSQTGVSNAPGGDRTSQSFWIWLPTSKSTFVVSLSRYRLKKGAHHG